MKIHQETIILKGIEKERHEKKKREVMDLSYHCFLIM